MRYLLIILIFAASSFGFPLTSWVPFGSDRVELCWDPITEATQYDLYQCGSFYGNYAFSNAVASPGIAHPRFGNLPGREFLFVKALNAAHEVIATSDTIGCYYLMRYAGNPTGIQFVSFGLGGLEYREIVGDSGCVYSDNVSTRPSDIIGGQTIPGSLALADRITRLDAGAIAYRALGSTWFGNLESLEWMILGRTYRYVTHEANRRPPILTGRARSDYSVSQLITVTAPVPPGLASSTPVSFPIIDIAPISELGLMTSGLAPGTLASADRVTEQTGGRFAYVTFSGEWHGRLTECAPEAAYWIIDRSYGSNWTYNTGNIGQP